MSEHDLSLETIVGIGTLGAVNVEGVIGGVALPISGSVDVTDRAARLVGIVDTELPAAAALADGAANPTTPMIGADLLGYSINRALWQRIAVDPVVNSDAPSYLITRGRAHSGSDSIDPAANTGGTITLAAAGAGLFHYIFAMRFVRVATAALAGAAILTITTTNIVGGPQWRVGNAMAAGGTQIDMDIEFEYPLRSLTANTPTTIVFPAPGAAVSWSCRVFYFVSAEAR